MERYLLFDAGCSVCNQLAQAIEEAAGGKLEAISIRERRAMKWLDQAYPAGWEHQPYLMTVDGGRVQAFAGLGMALRLGWLLGPRQGWRVWNLALRYGVALPAGGEFSAERRGFLKRVGGLLAGLILIRDPGEPWFPTEPRVPGEDSTDSICYGCSCCWGTVWEEGCCCGLCCGDQGTYDYCRWYLYVWKGISCDCGWNCSTSPCVSHTLCAC
jgi:predicted DCC family thiol-disulfide oxidoreductase YuxK